MSAPTVRIGNMLGHTETLKGPGCATLAQFDAAMNWFKSNPCAWWCMNVFSMDPGDKPFTGSIHIAYYDPAGRFSGVRITRTGRVKLEYAYPADGAAAEQAEESIAVYGAFKGGAL